MTQVAVWGQIWYCRSRSSRGQTPNRKLRSTDDSITSCYSINLIAAGLGETIITVIISSQLNSHCLRQVGKILLFTLDIKPGAGTIINILYNILLFILSNIGNRTICLVRIENSSVYLFIVSEKFSLYLTLYVRGFLTLYSLLRCFGPWPFSHNYVVERV